MKLIRATTKRTAFNLEKSLIGEKVLIYSDKMYETAGYSVNFDGQLNLYTLEVIVKSISSPKWPAIKNDVPASTYLFSTYIKSFKLDYDPKNKLIKGPSGARLRVVLRDECHSWGYADIYELIL